MKNSENVRELIEEFLESIEEKPKLGTKHVFKYIEGAYNTDKIKNHLNRV